MKSKLQLAIVSIVLPFVLQSFVDQFSDILFNPDGFALGNALNFLISISSLGTLPFFFALYKSQDFNELIKNEKVTPDRQEVIWIKHFLVRIGTILGSCFVVFGISFFTDDIDIGDFIM